MVTSDTTPLNPPIPIPDVPSADADARGLPDRSELSLREKVIVDASAFADIGLRTAVASMVAAAMIPSVLTTAVGRQQSRQERERLAFYTELAGEHDPALSFPAPTELPRVSARRANPIAERIARGVVENVSFRSGFEAVNPAMRDSWRALGNNNTARFQHWRHDDGPRPTLCVIHGFMGSAYLFNGLFFSLPWFFRSGYDVALFTLPFHSRRAEKYSPFSGYGYFSHGMSGFAEAMAQAVHDFRSMVDYLESTGVERVALTGLSLGGYTSALLAAVEPRLQAVIPNVPVVSVESEIRDWFPANLVMHGGQLLGRIDHDEFAAATAYHSPLNYAPLVAKDRRLIITGLGDRLAPPEQAEMLWHHWDKCALHWFPGNHVLHVSQPAYLRRMTAFLRPYMF
ncbi:prolyl oligopeptidase family serine peptidase [Mycolicibacter longobardus]|uniref:Peptidase n=1 Tax=Mycolicibacter longobardus TaxID=1108812 RepID=A0A1X1YBC8_9MYCO|nr:prolyl oligopeptidase family serine peptidase [Mycolicibacter longobardus]MCV7385346.1 prolyl oligopeptidase family serine peptidase [Mycolicibacter longobardus]ORW08320.1 peptidase [Mycolicibacter longobardus]